MSPPAVGRERAAITQRTWGPPREISTSPAPCTFTTRKKRTLGNKRIDRVGTTRMALTNSTADVEQWCIVELALHGSAEGNPYLDVELTAQFAYKHRMVEVDGFYDGNGIYHIRFMPDAPGTWRYFTRSNLNALNGAEGTFTCVAPTPGHHGPVRVSNPYHFTYADGTPYKQVGTTCYAWTHQSAELE